MLIRRSRDLFIFIFHILYAHNGTSIFNICFHIYKLTHSHEIFPFANQRKTVDMAEGGDDGLNCLNNFIHHFLFFRRDMAADGATLSNHGMVGQ